MKNTVFGLFFDFDGLILDTESAVFQAVDELYTSVGQTLTLEYWSTIIGRSPDEEDLIGDLEALAGEGLDREKLQAQLDQRENELILAQDVLPGVMDYIAAAKEKGLKLAIVSSSTRAWVHGHLERLELLHYFDITCCSDDVARAKPNPALYELALVKLGLEPHQVIVLEDSPMGALAAKRAQLFCVVVPTAISAQASLDHADLRLKSLADLPLNKLLDRVQSF